MERCPHERGWQRDHFYSTQRTDEADHSKYVAANEHDLNMFDVLNIRKSAKEDYDEYFP